MTSNISAAIMAASKAAEEDMVELKKDINTAFLVVFGNMVLLMQCGFGFLEAGSVRSKNTSNILLKNVLDSFIAGIAYWTVGFGFAYGKGNDFIGWHKFASSEMEHSDLSFFFFQFVFAATASTIVSGALAERCELVAYFVYSISITGWIYPLVTHWIWSSDGDNWLSRGLEYEFNGTMEYVGFHDFAGSGVVHCVGGVASFFGAAILGPRIGRFHKESGQSVSLRGHSVPFVALGGLLLLFGFMAFNGGSQLHITQPGDGAAVSLAVVNTVLSGSVAAITTLFIRRIGIIGTTWSLLYSINGALTGMVSICAGCNVIHPWGAIVVGAIGAISYNFTSWFVCKIKIDDPLDAVAVHFGGGAWGLIAVAFLDYEKGILMNWDQRSGLKLAWQLAGLAVIIAWTGVHCVIIFGTMRLLGIFRVPEEMERKGLDIPKHGEPAYPLESYGHGYYEQILTILENGDLMSQKLGFLVNKDTGPYESPEVKKMNHSQARALSTLEMNDGHSNGAFISDGVEKTSL